MEAKKHKTKKKTIKKNKKNKQKKKKNKTNKQKNKQTKNKKKKKKKKTPLFTCYKDSRPCSTVSQYQLDAPVTYDTRHLCHTRPPQFIYEQPNLTAVCSISINWVALFTHSHGPRQKTYLRTCAKCTDSAHPTDLLRIIRGFALCSYIL